jgi:hypothetical protein
MRANRGRLGQCGLVFLGSAPRSVRGALLRACLEEGDPLLLRGWAHLLPYKEECSTMKWQLLAALGLFCCAVHGRGAEFKAPVRLKADGAVIRVESPGFACPCLADIDGDGKMDLLVGQFNKGKIQVFKGLGGLRFAKGTWLQAQGQVAEVPGVW